MIVAAVYKLNSLKKVFRELVEKLENQNSTKENLPRLYYDFIYSTKL